MKWGFFSITHIVSLIVAALIIVGLYFALRKLSAKWQTIILGILSFSGIAAIIFNLVAWNSPWEYLPLHLCSINALILPYVVFSKNKLIGNLLIFWSLGALLALLFNTPMKDVEIFSWTFAFYYFPHVLEFGIPWLLFALKLVKKEVKYFIPTMVITVEIFAIIHFVNVILNKFFIDNNIVDYAGNVIQVNYMFTLAPNNPALDLLYSILPYQFWYLMLALPIVAIYLAIVYLPQIISYFKARKAA